MGFAKDQVVNEMTDAVKTPTDFVSSSTGGLLAFAQSESNAHLLEPYLLISGPCILLSIMTITLNSFVIDHYRRSQITVIPLIYTMISSSDILTAVGVIYQSITTTLFHKRVIEKWTEVDKYHAVISYTLIAVSYRSSIFNNLVLAVYRTVMVLRPFRQKNMKTVVVVSALYGATWALIAAVDICLSFQTWGAQVGLGFGYKSYIMATTLGKDIEDLFDSDECSTNLEMSPDYNQSNFRSDIAQCNSNLYSVLEAIFRVLFTVIPFLLPVLIVTITCVIQAKALYKPSRCPTSNDQRHAAITVFLMSALFIGCNSAYAIYIVLLKFSIIWDPEISTIAVLGTFLPILNAALNPVIIISRCNGLRGIFLNQLLVLIDLERAVRRLFCNFETRIRNLLNNDTAD